jgi:lysophosphatidate acyltransferase
MVIAGTVFVDRGNSLLAIQALKSAGQMMASLGLRLMMFPEGTRHSTDTPDLLLFKKGGFHLAIQTGTPIIPIVAENYWWLYHKNVFESGKMKVRGMVQGKNFKLK